MGVAGLLDGVVGFLASAVARIPVWLDVRVLAAGLAVCAAVAAVLALRARRRRQAQAVRLEWGIHTLKEKLRSRLSEPREFFDPRAAAFPTLGASTAFEADLEAAARSVMVEAGGKPAKAKHLLRKQLQGNSLNGSEAACWRQLGALSLIDSTHDAVRAYARAADLAPDDAQAQMLAGVLYLRDGRLEAAEAAFRRQMELAGEGPDGAAIRCRAGVMLGDALVAREEPEKALEAYRAARREAEALAEREPEIATHKRELSLIHDRIADVLLARGDTDKALESYRRSLAVMHALAKRDAARIDWQRDLSVSHDRVGEALERKGDLEGALGSYREGLKIAEALARRLRNRPDLQWDLSSSLDRIGDVLAARGNGTEARAHYRRALEIAEAVTGGDGGRLSWQRELAASYHKVGALEAQAGNDAEAIELLERGRAIIAGLDRIAEHRAQWRSDLRKFDQALETMRY
jgi:tetratricopeptide (TPR) repeat protein